MSVDTIVSFIKMHFYMEKLMFFVFIDQQTKISVHTFYNSQLKKKAYLDYLVV